MTQNIVSVFLSKMRDWGIAPIRANVLRQQTKIQHFLSSLSVPDWDRPERRITVRGVENFRDVGGYLTQTGQRVKFGVVFRSGSLNALQAEDWPHHFQIQRVCDLRSVGEVKQAPDCQVDGVAYEPLPISTPERRWRRLAMLLINPLWLLSAVRYSYLHSMIDQHGPTFGVILCHIAEGRAPLLIHCTAGKDRTGVAIALLLSLLGVDDETIIYDYALSNHSYPHFRTFAEPLVARLPNIGLTADSLAPLLVANPEILRETFAYVRQKFGTVEQYLMQRAGISASICDAIRAQMLVD